MTDLKFALWDAFPESEVDGGSSIAEVYDRHIGLAQLVEQLGYHSYFVIEHQNRELISSPSVYLTGVAMRTSVLRVGAMIWQLPFHHPLRLAEEVGILDQLSHGRVEFGTGIGIHEHEFLRWGLDFYARGEMSREALEIIQMAWTQDEVTYDGKYWHFDEALPAPKPFQQPTPPIWVGAHSKAALEFAAKGNFHVSQNIDVDDVVAEKFDYYRQVWRECNHPGPMPSIFLQRIVHVAETDAQARAEAEPCLLGRVNVPSAGAIQAGGSFGRGRVTGSRVGWGSSPRGMGTESALPDNAERGRVFRMMAEDYDFSIENGVAIIGSPETVARKIAEQQKYVGYDLLATTHSFGSMDPALIEKSIRLFGEEVIPAFR